MEPETTAPVAEEVKTGEDDSLALNTTVDELAESLNLIDPAEPEVVEQPKEEKPAEPAVAATPAPTEPPAPDTWRPEAKAEWAKVPASVKAELAKRESDIARYVSESKPFVQAGQAFQEILTPYQQLFQKYEIDPKQHLATLLEGHMKLILGSPQEKAAMFKQLALDAQIDARALFTGEETPVDPATQAWKAEATALRNELSQLKQNMTGVTSTLNSARESELSMQIMTFANDPKHPHFWTVASDVQALIENKSARTLTEAYELAVSRNPVTRAALVKEEAEKLADSRAKQGAEKVLAARKTMGANVKSRGSGRAAPAEESLEDTLAATLADINSR